MGADRAGIQAQVETSADRCIVGVKHLFPKIKPKKFAGSTQTFVINEKYINAITVEDATSEWSTIQRTKIKVDFSYSRFNAENNIFPLESEIGKIIVEESIAELFRAISGENVQRESLSFYFIELTIQIEVAAFYLYYTIISTMYKSLRRNLKTKKRQSYGDYDPGFDHYYSTGFLFQLCKGWVVEIYSKSHEHMKKHPGEVITPKLRMEHKIAEAILKNKCGTSMVKDLSLKELEQKILKPMNNQLLSFFTEEFEREISVLEKEFQELEDIKPRKIENILWLQQENIFDEKTINYVVTQAAKDKSDRTQKRYREFVKSTLGKVEKKTSPRRTFFGNIERVEEFAKKFLFNDLELKVSYKNGFKKKSKKNT